MKLYHDILISHYQNPYHRGRLVQPNFSEVSHNPSCGDVILMEGIITDQHFSSLVFEGSGCIISQATASLLTTYLQNHSIKEIASLDSNFIIRLIGIELGPVRLRCALLSLEALSRGVNSYMVNQGDTHAQSNTTDPGS